MGWARPRPLGKPAGAGRPPTPGELALRRGGAAARRVAQPPAARATCPRGAGGAGLIWRPRLPAPTRALPGRGRRIPPRGQGGASGPLAPLPRRALGRPFRRPHPPPPRAPRRALAPRPHPPCPARRGPPVRARASGEGGRDQPVTPVLAAVMVPRARRRRRARRGAHPARTRSLTSRAPSARATRPGPRLACRRALLPPGRGACGRGVGGRGRVRDLFFFNQSCLCRRGCEDAEGWREETAEEAALQLGSGRVGASRFFLWLPPAVSLTATTGFSSTGSSRGLGLSTATAVCTGAGHTRGTYKDTA